MLQLIKGVGVGAGGFDALQDLPDAALSNLGSAVELAVVQLLYSG